MVRLQYVGNIKRKIDFTTMGKGYSFSVRPGDIISVPDVAVMACKGCGTFEEVERRKPSSKVQVIKTTVSNNDEPVEETTTIDRTVVDPFDVVEPEDEVEDPADDINFDNEEEEVSETDETKEIPIVPVDEVVEAHDEAHDERAKLENPIDNDVDYTAFRKSELKDMCKERSLPVSGNRDDLIARLVNYDNGYIPEE